MKNKPKSRKENIVVQDFENEVLVYDLNINKVYCLNETSSLVWSLCDGKTPVSEISRSLSQMLNTEVSADLVWLAIEQFKRDRLLDESEPLEIDFGGLTRGMRHVRRPVELVHDVRVRVGLLHRLEH